MVCIIIGIILIIIGGIGLTFVFWDPIMDFLLIGFIWIGILVTMQGIYNIKYPNNENINENIIEIQVNNESEEEISNMIDKCSKCESESLFVEIQGNKRGLYCGNCGKWQKWITKEELQVAKFKGLKIIEDK